MSETGERDERDAVQPPAESEAALDARLRALSESLEARRPIGAEGADVAPRSGRSQGMPLRLASEFVAGILVGAAIGWFIDGWLGTKPWGLIVFLLLGFVAGVLNALRTAGVVAEAPSRRPSADVVQPPEAKNE